MVVLDSLRTEFSPRDNTPVFRFVSPLPNRERPGRLINVISVVCVYDDRETLEACLLQGLKAQMTECDLILVDNTESRFKSAAQALNYGGGKARGNYVVFVHQDMVLGSEPSLNEIAKTLDQLPDLGIAGAAGCPEGTHGTLSNISHGTPPRPAGTAGTITAPMRVQTLDECLTIVP